MKFLICGDLHGNRPKIYFQDFDAIITPGDFCSSDEIRRYDFQALRERHRNPDSKVRWYDLTGKKEAVEIVKKSFDDGRNVLEYLDSFNVPVYVVPGNADLTPKKEGWKFLRQNRYEKMLEGLENIIDVQYRIIDAGEHQIIGYGISSSPEYPRYKDDLDRLKACELLKRKKEYEKASKKITSLFKRASKPVIFLSHNVPFKTKIDKITNKESPRYGRHYGSLITRETIEKYQPPVCIGGHMHEHFGKCKIGRTVCINAGFGSLVNTLMELENDRITRLQFHKEAN